MAKKTAPGTALATDRTQEEEREAAALAELSDFFDSVEVDGLEEVGGEDLKIALRLWNMGGLDKDGRAYPKDVFFDTITEELSNELDCVMLLTRKSKRWDEYDNDTKKTIVHCASADRLAGKLADGSQRPCLGCPDDAWFQDDKGKAFRKCGEVHTVVAVDRISQRPFLIRFKKTGLKPFRNYLMAHHWNGRASGGRRGNIPLYVYGCKISLVMHEGGLYALPVLSRGAMLEPDAIKVMHDNAKAYLEIMGDVIEHADAVDAKIATVEADGSLSSDDFADD